MALHGKLINHGTAPYQDNPQNQLSYFAELEDQGKTKKVWGKEIQSAIINANVKIGDDIVLNNLGKQSVSIPDPKDNQKSITVQKNMWEVELYEPPKELINSLEPDLERVQEQQLSSLPNREEKAIKETFKLSELAINNVDLPENLRNNYILKVKNRALQDEKINYYDKSDTTTIAFEDRKTGLHTSKEDEKTINAMLDLAQSKGWSSINLKGTEAFKRQAWLEASIRGIEVKGFKPSEKDMAELEARQEQRSNNAVLGDEQRSKEINMQKTADIEKHAVAEPVETKISKQIEVQEQNPLSNFELEDDIDYAEEFYKHNKPMSPEEIAFDEKYEYHENGYVSDTTIENYFDSQLQNFVNNLESSKPEHETEPVETINSSVDIPKTHDEITDMVNSELLKNGWRMQKVDGKAGEYPSKTMIDRHGNEHQIYIFSHDYTMRINTPYLNSTETTIVGREVLHVNYTHEEAVQAAERLDKQAQTFIDAQTEKSMAQRYTFEPLAPNDMSDWDNMAINGVHVHDTFTDEHYRFMSILDSIDHESYNPSLSLDQIADGDVYAKVEYFQNDYEYRNRDSNTLVEQDSQILKKLGIADKVFIQQFPINGKTPNHSAIQVVNSINVDTLKNLIGQHEIKLPKEAQQALESVKESGYTEKEQSILLGKWLDTSNSFNILLREGGFTPQERLGLLIEDVKVLDVERFVDTEEKENIKFNMFVDILSQKTSIDLSHEKIPGVIEVDNRDKQSTQQNIDTKIEISEIGHALQPYFSNVDKYPLSDEQLLSIESWRRNLNERYAAYPDFVTQKMQDLNNKIPDISSGKFNLPAAPEVLVQPQVDVQINKQGNRDRSL
ncbi:hypothetical protein HG534_10930 [Moraxella osloensis]|nr:LPD7 domain-containing protein [Moraxella osloensis]MBW4016805.1 hypothetical protein [Moraxella osloensis]MBW4019201.1 hypothetical protein [Moraxella osloensis]VWX31791.1 hypothetical protein ENHY17A_600004 [Moraxellaceae bacterium 17A]